MGFVAPKHSAPEVGGQLLGTRLRRGQLRWPLYLTVYKGRLAPLGFCCAKSSPRENSLREFCLVQRPDAVIDHLVAGGAVLSRAGVTESELYDG